jgi:hypothetical protein
VHQHIPFYKNGEHIMFTMGDDFHYQNARMNFKNMDKVVISILLQKQGANHVHHIGDDFHYQNARMNLNNIPDKVGILISRMGSMQEWVMFSIMGMPG